MIYKMPRPQIGDVMERLALDGLVEEATINSMKYNKEDPNFWNAVMVTRNGFEFLASHTNPITQHDWRPKGWSFHPKSNRFLPPGATWDAENNDVVFVGGTEPIKAETLDLPPPVVGERYMSWRSRAYKAVPQLKDNPLAPEVLSNTWKNREQLNY